MDAYMHDINEGLLVCKQCQAKAILPNNVSMVEVTSLCINYCMKLNIVDKHAVSGKANFSGSISFNMLFMVWGQGEGKFHKFISIMVKKKLWY